MLEKGTLLGGAYRVEGIIEVGGGIDTRSAIYNLGAIIYHLLTGTKPAAGYFEFLPKLVKEISLPVKNLW